jgi:hypothetical protein
MIDAGSFNLILLAEHRLGIPPLFYFKLIEIKDHWAFVLKLHALFEGTIQRLLEEKQNLSQTAGQSMIMILLKNPHFSEPKRNYANVSENLTR